MKASHFSADCLEFISLLYKHDVEYVIVGGEAVIYHGHIRLTGDVDFFYDRSHQNCLKLYQALKEFWGNDIPGELTLQDLKSEGYFIQFGLPPNRIDLMNSIDGVTFDTVWNNRVSDEILRNKRQIPVYYIGLAELIKNKSSTARPKDQEDLIYLKSNFK